MTTRPQAIVYDQPHTVHLFYVWSCFFLSVVSFGRCCCGNFVTFGQKQTPWFLVSRLLCKAKLTRRPPASCCCWHQFSHLPPGKRANKQISQNVQACQRKLVYSGTDQRSADSPWKDYGKGEAAALFNLNKTRPWFFFFYVQNKIHIHRLPFDSVCYQCSPYTLLKLLERPTPSMPII